MIEVLFVLSYLVVGWGIVMTMRSLEDPYRRENGDFAEDNIAAGFCVIMWPLVAIMLTLKFMLEWIGKLTRWR